MTWTVKFSPHALEELSELDKLVQKRIIKFIEERLQLAENPRLLGTFLRGNLKDL